MLESAYPKKYIGRESAIKTNNEVVDGTPSGYAKVIVTVKAKSINKAATSALEILDIQRAIWNLLSNSFMELWGNAWHPINKIRLGGAHTVHKENGRLATESFWFEPNFVKAKLFKHSKPVILAKNSKWVMKEINKLPYGDIIKDVLVRYVRALDERDQNVALIKLWGALEALTAPSSTDNYDLVVRRVSFLFSERNYHKQVLEHLREYRNRSIHAGDQNERGKDYCYQLHFYFYRVVVFHLKSAGEFSSLDEANSFLDLPSDKEILDKRKRWIEKAIDFVP